MSQQLIKVGASVNDKTGDPIRTAFVKVNANFTDLYAQISGLELDAVIPSQTGNASTVLSTDGTTLSWRNTIGSIGFTSNTLYDASGMIVGNSSSTPSAMLSIPANGFDTGVPLFVINNAGNQIGIQTNNHTWLFDAAGKLNAPAEVGLDLNWTSDTASGGPGDRHYDSLRINNDHVTGLYITNTMDGVPSSWLLGKNGTITFPDGTTTTGATIITPGAYDIQSIGNTYIQTSANVGAKTWTYGADGTLTLPASANQLYQTNNALLKSISDIQISAGDDIGSNWTFGGNGHLTFPDNTVQTTAYDGSTAGTGDVRFVGNAMYDLSGIIIENADLSHGSTASILLPANGATGEGSEILINNSYSDVAIGTGTGGSLPNSWRFGTDGSLSIPPSGRITQPPFSIGPFSVVDGNTYPGYSELYINQSDVPNLDQLIHEGDRVEDGNDSNNFVTITRPISTNGSLWTITFTASWPNGSPQTLTFRSIGGTWIFSTNGNLTAPGDIIVGSNTFNNGGNEQHFVIDASNYWTSIQWKNFTAPQDPGATPFECQAQLLRVFASENTVTAVCNVSNPREELVAVTAVRPNNTTYNGVMISTSDGKIPDAPYNDGQGTRHDWVFGGDGNLTTPQGGTNTTSSIGQGPDSDWVNPNNNTWHIRTYNGGTNFTYAQGADPTIWFDAINSPLGNLNQFRGAIIEYHAYVNGAASGTYVGQIIVAQDQIVEPTHTENASFYGNSSAIKFWERPNYQQLGYSNSALTTGQQDNVMIMWTAKVFYGQEFAC